MTHRSRRVGVVLAGGFSTRFGDADKALAPVEGTPMLRRVVDRVGRITDAVVVNCRAEQRDSFAAVLDGCDVPVAFAIDAVPDEGPLVGLAGALAVHDSPVSVVVACDMPFVDPSCLAFLARERAAAATDAAVPSPDGDVQPAQAVLATGPARQATEAAVADGETSLRSLYERVDATVVGGGTLAGRGFEESFVDVNTASALPTQ